MCAIILSLPPDSLILICCFSEHGEQYEVTKSVIIKYKVRCSTSYVLLQRYAKLAAPILPSRNFVVPNLMRLPSLWSDRPGAYYKRTRSIFDATQNFYRPHRRSVINNPFLYYQVLSVEFRNSFYSCLSQADCTWYLALPILKLIISFLS